MAKVKTFTNTLKAFHAKQEIQALDDMVNLFMSEHNIQKVYSVSDTCTTDDKGATIGLIRVLAYE
jgi:hypothetical protein